MYTSLYRAAYSRWNNFLLLKESSASKQAGVTVFLNAESSFTGDPHFTKVFVEESKRYGLFRWTFHLAVLWHFKVRPAFFFFPYLLFHSLPLFFLCVLPEWMDLHRITWDELSSSRSRWSSIRNTRRGSWRESMTRRGIRLTHADHFLRVAVHFAPIAPRTGYLRPDAFDNRAGQRYFRPLSRETKRRQDFDSLVKLGLEECWM